MTAVVQTHIALNADGLFVNGVRHFSSEETSLKAILTHYYKVLEIDYPKFYKMDALCKLAFIGVEYLKKENMLKNIADDRIAMIFQNKSSSLDTDVRHQDKINEGGQTVSPAIFVYTLPNILMGELAIRNGWYGENLFVLVEAFQLEKWMSLCQMYFDNGKADFVIGGWAEVLENSFDLQLYLVDKA